MYNESYFNDGLFGLNSTEIFSNIFPTYTDFQAAYNELPDDMKVCTKLEMLYTLLIARYANSTISGLDLDQWKLRLFTVVYTNAPYWEKTIEIMKDIRSMNLDDIVTGTKTMTNVAMNPGDEISDMDAEISTINQQNTVKFTKDKTKAYYEYLMLLGKDYTEEFLDKFKPLFISIVNPQFGLWYGA